MSGFKTIMLQRFAPTQGIFSDAKCADNNVFFFRPMQDNSTAFASKYGVSCWDNAYKYMLENYNYMHVRVNVSDNELYLISGTSEDFECKLMPDIQEYAEPGEENAVIKYLSTRGVVSPADADIFCKYSGYYPQLIRLNFVDDGQDPYIGLQSAASSLTSTLWSMSSLVFPVALVFAFFNDMVFEGLARWLTSFNKQD